MIELDSDSPTPPYEQVRAQLAQAISHGQLPVGTRLLPVRQLAADLGLAVNTVARAYHELELAGLVETRGRAGTVVRTTDAVNNQLHTAARNYALLARNAGLTTEEAVQIIHTALDPAAARL